MKKMFCMLVCLVMMALAAVACAEPIGDGDYDIVTLPAQSGKVYENIALLNPLAVNGPEGDQYVDGAGITLADSLDAAMTMLKDQLHLTIDGELYFKFNFFENHEATGGRCRQVLIYLDRSGETYFDILMDMDGTVHQCELRCAF